jgi:hypothetical protein
MIRSSFAPWCPQVDGLAARLSGIESAVLGWPSAAGGATRTDGSAATGSNAATAWMGTGTEARADGAQRSTGVFLKRLRVGQVLTSTKAL